MDKVLNKVKDCDVILFATADCTLFSDAYIKFEEYRN